MRLQLGSYILAGVVTSILAPSLTARADTRAARPTGTPPTVESALAAEEELARAMRENDADGIGRMLSDDWAVISARGDVAEGKDVFPSGTCNLKCGCMTNFFMVSRSSGGGVCEFAASPIRRPAFRSL